MADMACKYSFINKISHYNNYIAGMELIKNDDYIIVNSGLKSNTFNIAVLLNGTIDAIEFVLSYYSKKQLTFALWSFVNLQPYDFLLQKYNLKHTETEVAMVATKDNLIINNSTFNNIENFTINQAQNSNSILQFSKIIVSLFGNSIEGANVKEFYNKVSHNSNEFFKYNKLYLGFHNNMAVSSALVHQYKDSYGIYDVATLPEHRNKGYGSAMFNYILKINQLDSKINKFVLQSSIDGLRIYQKSGFESIQSIYVYEN